MPELSQIISLPFSSFLQKGLIIIFLHASNLFCLWCYHFIFAELAIFKLKMCIMEVWATFIKNTCYFISVISKSHTRQLTFRCFSCLCISNECKQLRGNMQITAWNRMKHVECISMGSDSSVTALSYDHNSATEPKAWIRTLFCYANTKWDELLCHV